MHDHRACAVLRANGQIQPEGRLDQIHGFAPDESSKQHAQE